MQTNLSLQARAQVGGGAGTIAPTPIEFDKKNVWEFRAQYSYFSCKKENFLSFMELDHSINIEKYMYKKKVTKFLATVPSCNFLDTRLSFSRL